jgi:hypothetical protein
LNELIDFSSSGLLVAAQDSTEQDSTASSILMEGLSAEHEQAIEETKETFVFQAEVNRLMDIIINSLCKSNMAWTN